jgi:hypothetical protein
MRRHSCQWRVKVVIFMYANTFQIGQFYLNQRVRAPFLIINAKVFCLVTENVLFESEFLAVNKQHIILLTDHLDAQQILISRAKISLKKGRIRT